MRNVEGDMSTVSAWYRLGDDHFLEDVVPKLTSNDLIVVIAAKTIARSSPQLAGLLAKALAACPTVKIGLVSYRERDPTLAEALKGATQTIYVDITLPSEFLLSGMPSFMELSVKYVLNAISTGAHVLKGKIFRNLMIDLSISNNKLYFRGIEILSKLLSIPTERATDALLRSIHLVDEVRLLEFRVIAWACGCAQLYLIA